MSYKNTNLADKLNLSNYRTLPHNPTSMTMNINDNKLEKIVYDADNYIRQEIVNKAHNSVDAKLMQMAEQYGLEGKQQYNSDQAEEMSRVAILELGAYLYTSIFGANGDMTFTADNIEKTISFDKIEEDVRTYLGVDQDVLRNQFENLDARALSSVIDNVKNIMKESYSDKTRQKVSATINEYMQDPSKREEFVDVLNSLLREQRYQLANPEQLSIRDAIAHFSAAINDGVSVPYARKNKGSLVEY